MSITASLLRPTMQAERLAQICELTRKIILKTSQKDSSDAACPESLHIPPLNLPSPHEVLAQYEYRNLPPGFFVQCTKRLSYLSQNLCSRYEETCRKLARNSYDTIGDSRVRMLCDRLAASFQREYQSKAVNRVEEIMISAEERMNSASQQSTQPPNRSKFKHVSFAFPRVYLRAHYIALGIFSFT